MAPPAYTDDGLVWFNFYDPIIDPLVLTGSSLSLLMTSLVLLTFVFYHQEQRTFRHALVLNLALAEFINSLNATISGAYFVVTKNLTPGALCSINGWTSQVSVQAADFSVFAIAVITLLTITEKVYMPAVSRTKKILICLSIWVVPLTTGSIAVGLDVMMPAGANWCWISPSRTDLRYGLTHAWRFAIIFSIICIYSYVYYHTSRHFKSFAVTRPSNDNTTYSRTRQGSFQMSPDEISVQYPIQNPAEVEGRESRSQRTVDCSERNPRSQRTMDCEERGLRGQSWLRLSTQSMDFPHPALPKLAALKEEAPFPRSVKGNASTEFFGKYSFENRPLTRPGTSDSNAPPNAKRTEREVKRMLLLNAYPILYVLLWIPGLVNRLLQATGATPSSRVLDALQAASVFIGFANAVTYGFNRHLRQRIWTDLWYWWARRSGR